MNSLQFSFQRARQLLLAASKIPHSSPLPGQPLSNAIILLQNDISHLISCHGYELECYILKTLFCHSIETARDEKNLQQLSNEDSQVCLLLFLSCLLCIHMVNLFTGLFAQISAVVDLQKKQFRVTDFTFL